MMRVVSRWNRWKNRVNQKWRDWCVVDGDKLEVNFNGSAVTGFGSFDNSACNRILEPGDLRLGQAVIKKVTVVKIGVNSGNGDGGSCFGIQVWTDTAKLANMVIARFRDR